MKKSFLIIAVVIFTVYALAGVVNIEAQDEPGYIDTHAHLHGRYQSRGSQSSGDKQKKISVAENYLLLLKGLPNRLRGCHVCSLKLTRVDPRQRSTRRKTADSLAKNYEAAADKLVRQMAASGVAVALIMPSPQIAGQKGGYDYQHLLGAVKKYPHRISLVAGGGTLNPLIYKYKDSEVTSKIRAQFEQQAEKLIRAGAKAFGEMSALHFSFNENHIFFQTSPDHALFLLLADIAARNNVPIDLHIEAVPNNMDLPIRLARISKHNPPTIPANIAAFERLLYHNPDAKIVWQHVGWDNTGHMTTELLQRMLKAHPNLYLALRVVQEQEPSHRGTQRSNGIVDGNGKIRWEWLELISNFADRCMLGSDEFFAVSGQAPSKSQSFDETFRILSQLPLDIARKVGYENAEQVYGLKATLRPTKTTTSYQTPEPEQTQDSKTLRPRRDRKRERR